ncbi:MAG: hypothetical protein WD825_07125, partial [Gemmatimonadaceae bacterium]
YRMAARGGLAVLGIGVAIALIIGGWGVIAPESRSPDRSDSVSGSITKVALGAARVRAPTSPPALPGPPGPPILPSIAEGRRELGDSMFAVREGPQVTVNFDTETLRTRFDWKFEGVVRATLPLVFGAGARAALDSIPAGTFVRGGDLMNELPTRGIPLKMGEHTLRVWPITRPGRDGPIVVAYRAATAR